MAKTIMAEYQIKLPRARAVLVLVDDQSETWVSATDVTAMARDGRSGGTDIFLASGQVVTVSTPPAEVVDRVSAALHEAEGAES